MIVRKRTLKFVDIFSTPRISLATIANRIQQVKDCIEKLSSKQELSEDDFQETKSVLLQPSTQKYSKLLNSKEAQLYGLVVERAISSGSTVELLKLIPIGQGMFQRKPVVVSLQHYFVSRVDSLNPYQLCLAVFWLSFYQHHRLLESALKIKELKAELNGLPEDIRKEAAVMFSYAQLIQSPIANPQKELVLYSSLEDGLQLNGRNRQARETKQLKLYVSPSLPVEFKDMSEEIKVRSQLQNEFECSLSALRLSFQRQVRVLNCYTVDYMCKEKLIDILGPSHYLHWGELKGSEVVRRKVIERHGLQYRTVGHAEWSKLNGIRKQLAFTEQLLL